MVIDARGPSIGPSVAEILVSHAGGSGSPTKTAARVADAIAARGDDGTWLSSVPRVQLLATAVGKTALTTVVSYVMRLKMGNVLLRDSSTPHQNHQTQQPADTPPSAPVPPMIGIASPLRPCG